MSLYEINGKRPVIGEGCWIAPNASVIGDVQIGRGCYIGFGAVIRGDFGLIAIGDGSIIEDNVVIHAAQATRIGKGVIVGHQAMVHDAEIGDNVLVGMQSLVGSRVVIGADAIVAEQSHLRDGTTVDAGTIVAGRPAEPVKKATEAHRQAMAFGQAAYASLGGQYIRCPESGS
ncbi:MAG: gamma carbonic anhydrase family protein [Desulfobacterales bacterium]|nr:gamma carbonic anhydrase family protein [Desulfobacterales bacterium]